MSPGTGSTGKNPGDGCRELTLRPRVMTMNVEYRKAPQPAPNTEECWQVIERVAESPNLKRAFRLKEFLFYVGRRSIKESSSDIHEQEIGRMVFGRKDSYDTSQDNIVRVSATELRKRVDAYFASDGEHEPLIFEIPRGSYTPVFRLRPIEPEPVVEPLAQAPVPLTTSAQVAAPKRPFTAAAALIALVLLCLGLAAASLTLWQNNLRLLKSAHAWRGQPALSALWPQFFTGPRQTDIVLGDTSFSFAQELLRRNYSLTEYLNRTYMDALQKSSGGADERFLGSFASGNSGSLGDFRVAQRIESLDYDSKRVLLGYAGDYSATSLMRNNVILVGSQRSNPWVELFADQRNFRILYDAAAGHTYVLNAHPIGNEQPSYAFSKQEHATLGYGVVSYLPTPDHKGQALIVEGTDSQATNVAGDFVTSEDSLSALFKHLPAAKLPYFEVLLRTKRVSGTPLQAEVIAYRTF
jgi:hypothetical protein